MLSFTGARINTDYGKRQVLELRKSFRAEKLTEAEYTHELALLAREAGGKHITLIHDPLQTLFGPEKDTDNTLNLEGEDE